jgi:DNA polymerase-3 subunit epsilon
MDNQPGILFIDVETTGFTRDLPLDHPDQPHIVQLAAMLTDPAGREMGKFSTLITPTGWEISPDAQRVHGITVEDCHRYGMPLLQALAALHGMAQGAVLVVAHNLAFDSKVLACEFVRSSAGVFPFAWVKTHCTMMEAVPLCKIPRRGGGGFKWPSLAEAHKHFLGSDFEDAHDALADVEACKRIYFAAIEKKAPRVGALP